VIESFASADTERLARAGIAEQDRICFTWAQGVARDVEIVDYH